MSNATGHIFQRSSAPAWLAGAVVATAVGLTLSAATTPLPGGDPLMVEDVVDAVAELVLGGLGVVLVRRGVAAGLGRALLLMSVLASNMWLCGGLADALAAGGSPPPAAQLLTLASTALFLPVFVLLYIAPMLLFPSGRLISAGWRWVVTAAVSGTAAAMASLLLAAGPVDEDVPAWGDNPLGVQALDGLTSALEVVGLVLILASLPAALAAAIVRVVRSHGARRTQMWWFVAGVLPLWVGLVTDTGASPVPSLISAVVIFAALLGGMAWPLLGAPGRSVTARSG